MDSLCSLRTWRDSTGGGEEERSSSSSSYSPGRAARQLLLGQRQRGDQAGRCTPLSAAQDGKKPGPAARSLQTSDSPAPEWKRRSWRLAGRVIILFVKQTGSDGRQLLTSACVISRRFCVLYSLDRAAACCACAYRRFDSGPVVQVQVHTE
jgi:hypothetical protein